jgi:hypothetical protein
MNRVKRECRAGLLSAGSGAGLFELDGRDVTERFVGPCVVTPADVFHDDELELGEDGDRVDRHRG